MPQTFASQLNSWQEEEEYLFCTKGEEHYYRMSAGLMERNFHPIRPAVLEFLRQSDPGDTIQVGNTLIIHVRHKWN